MFKKKCVEFKDTGDNSKFVLVLNNDQLLSDHKINQINRILETSEIKKIKGFFKE